MNSVCISAVLRSSMSASARSLKFRYVAEMPILPFRTSSKKSSCSRGEADFRNCSTQ